MARKPNFFLVGPPKCATTSLYHYLRQHPDVFLPAVKETRFFDLHYDDGIASYEETHFSGAGRERAVGEATATYSFLPFVADRIRRHYPDAKLIFSLRDPVDRAFSEWLMHQSMDREPYSFRHAIEQNARELGTTCLEGTEGADRYRERCRLMKAQRVQAYRVYIQGGLYGRHLQKYDSLFPKDQILLVHYDDLKRRLNQVLRDIFRFLDVDAEFVVPDLHVQNPYSYKKRYARWLYSTLGRERTHRLWRLVPGRLRERISSSVRNAQAERPHLSETDKRYVSGFFEADKRLWKARFRAAPAEV